MLRFYCVLFLSVLAWGQTTFEVASVKASPPATGAVDFTPPVRSVGAVRVSYRWYPLKRLIMDAYGLVDYQVDVPAAIAHERYDVAANKPRGTTVERERQMLQALLAERFHLTMHSENREMPVFVLLQGKSTAKLRPEKDAPDVPGCKSFGTLAEFAEILSHNLDRPVVDQTGVAGTYYFILAYSDSQAASNGGAGPTPPPPPAAPPPCPGWSAATMPHLASSIFEAVRDQMGLQLERRGTAHVRVYVVDHADRVPVPN